MHVGAGHLGPHASYNNAGTQSAAMLASRRAEETRRKLSAASSELEASASQEGAWMIAAWGGSGSSSGGGGDRSSGQSSEQGPTRYASQPAGQSSETASVQLEGEYGGGEGLGSYAGGYAITADSESAAQGAVEAVSRLSAEGARLRPFADALPSVAEEIQRTAASGAVSFWA